MDDKPIFKSRGPGVPGAFTGEEVVSEETIKELARRINGGHTMERKQTAVEWLIEELGEYFPHDIGGIHLMVEQAKQMEKEQMIEFAMYLHKVDDSKTGTDILMDEAEQYYNETYNKES